MWFRRISRRVDRAVKSGELALKNQETVGLSPESLRQLNRLGLTASRFLPGMAAGRRPSLRRRPSYDFREHRMYVPGDDIRFVDWNASSRQEHIFVKQGEYPKEATVNLLIDCSASMAWGEPPKSIGALELAAALGYVALSQSDRLIVQPLAGHSGHYLGPISGKGQVPMMLNYLRGVQFQGRTNFIESVQTFTHNWPGGLTIIFSDLLDVADLAATLEMLPFPTWDVVVLHLLHPQELKPNLLGDFEMKDVETGATSNYDVDDKALRIYREQLDTWLSDVDQICVEHNAFYALIPTDWSLYREMIPYLRSIQLLNPL